VKAVPTVTFEGTVFSGKGEGKKFLALPWVKLQIEQKLGFSPYPGTLNLHLNKSNQAKKSNLQTTTCGVEVTPQRGYFLGVLFRARIDSVECAVVVPKVPNYPRDVLEVIAPWCLREKLKLRDGSAVLVEVNV
jgi:riboflavin kinase